MDAVANQFEVVKRAPGNRHACMPVRNRSRRDGIRRQIAAWQKVDEHRLLVVEHQVRAAPDTGKIELPRQTRVPDSIPDSIMEKFTLLPSVCSQAPETPVLRSGCCDADDRVRPHPSLNLPQHRRTLDAPRPVGRSRTAARLRKLEHIAETNHPYGWDRSRQRLRPLRDWGCPG